MAELNTLSLKNDANLKAYYRFESGALTTDSGANGYTLTNINSVAEVSGKHSGAADLDGSTKYLDMPSAVFATGAQTIAFWFKPDNLGSDAYVLADYDAGSSTGLGILINSSEQIGIGVNGGVNTLQSGVLSTSVFSHIAFVINGASSILYVNGVSVATGTLSPTNNTNKLRINGRWVTANTGTAVGGTFEIDDFAVFTRALTATEITTIYNPGFDLTERITIGDTLTINTFRARTFTERITISDTVDISKVTTLNLNESITIGDTYSRVATFVRALTERITITDTLSKSRSMFRTFTESITINDIVTNGRALVRNYYESIVITAKIQKFVNGILTTIWTKVAKPTTSWTKIEKPTTTWTKTEKPDS